MQATEAFAMGFPDIGDLKGDGCEGSSGGYGLRTAGERAEAFGGSIHDG
jgi:hypothetical protein